MYGHTNSRPNASTRHETPQQNNNPGRTNSRRYRRQPECYPAFFITRPSLYQYAPSTDTTPSAEESGATSIHAANTHTQRTIANAHCSPSNNPCYSTPISNTNRSCRPTCRSNADTVLAILTKPSDTADKSSKLNASNNDITSQLSPTTNKADNPNLSLAIKPNANTHAITTPTTTTHDITQPTTPNTSTPSITATPSTLQSSTSTTSNYHTSSPNTTSSTSTNNTPPTTTDNANTTPPIDSTSPSMATEKEHTAPPTSNPRKVPDNQTTDAQNHTISIASLNIQNIKSNKPYLQELLKQHDIVCVQEHWLFNYEQNWVNNNFKNISTTIKSVDDEDPISHAQKITGYGGVAILSSNPAIYDRLKQLPDGNSRIQAMELKTKNTKMIIVNVYMPCRNSRSSSTDFTETLDMIREIISKYRNTHSIVLLGDFNSSLTRTPENPQDRKLKDFLKDQNILANTMLFQQEAPTFFHHNGKDNAQIDYIICIQSYLKSNTLNSEPTKIHAMHPLNTSDHTAISTNLILQESMTPTACTSDNEVSTEAERTFQKPRWTKCDK